MIMLCIGSLYAWSIIASELIENYGFSNSQSQIIFGLIIGVFPVTMIFVGQLGKKIKHRYFGYISGLLFFTGYMIAGFSQGSFILILLGIGLMAGIATGFGYWLSLTSPVQWYPNKKGLITGIAAAGFGLGAVFMSNIAEIILNKGYNVLQLLQIVGIAYGLIVILLSNFIFQAHSNEVREQEETVKISHFLGSKTFKTLFVGIFLGTFAGLLIIGSLSLIGGQYDITKHTLVLGVSIFAISNFLGRLTWGYISDHLGSSLTIFFALLVQAIAIISLNFLPLTDVSYLLLSFLIGFGFGGNFVLFARETAQVFGVKNLGIIYPYIFVGYAIAGIAGPFSGGLLSDISGTFFYAIILASFMSIVGSLLFLNQHFKSKKLKVLK